MSKDLFKEILRYCYDKSQADVASIKKSTLYSSAYRRGNLLEVHIPDAKIVILLVLR